jgi:hypothetical protein
LIAQDRVEPFDGGVELIEQVADGGEIGGARTATRVICSRTHHSSNH